MRILLEIEENSPLATAIQERERFGFLRTQLCKAALWNYLRLDEKKASL